MVLFVQFALMSAIAVVAASRGNCSEDEASLLQTGRVTTSDHADVMNLDDISTEHVDAFIKDLETFVESLKSQGSQDTILLKLYRRASQSNFHLMNKYSNLSAEFKHRLFMAVTDSPEVMSLFESIPSADRVALFLQFQKAQEMTGQEKALAGKQERTLAGKHERTCTKHKVRASQCALGPGRQSNSRCCSRRNCWDRLCLTGGCFTLDPEGVFEGCMEAKMQHGIFADPLHHEKSEYHWQKAGIIVKGQKMFDSNHSSCDFCHSSCDIDSCRRSDIYRRR